MAILGCHVKPGPRPLHPMSGMNLFSRWRRLVMESLFSPLQRFLGAFDIDVPGPFRCVDDDDRQLGRDLGVAIGGRRDPPFPIRLDPKFTGRQRDHQRGVSRQDAYLAVLRRQDEHLGRTFEKHLIRSHDFGPHGSYIRQCCHFPSSGRLEGLINLFDGAFHKEKLFRYVVDSTRDDFTKAFDGVLNGYIFSGIAGGSLSDEKGL